MEKKIGTITWFDLTVPNAEKIKDFYKKVVGWKPKPVSMGDYNDFIMNLPDDGETVTGVCHARGGNAGIPPQWLIYITVEDVHESARICTESGGKILLKPKKMEGYGEYCIIQDPAGAISALFTPATEN